MKSKFYLAAAAAIAFAACTNEEDLIQQGSSNQGSPISFVIGTDNDAQTRVHWSGYTLAWDENDLTTLYHGGTTLGSLSDVQNAIYKAQGDTDAEGKLVFKTGNMILPGQAIMVYPADTTFKYTGSGDLTVTIPAEQGVEGAERIHNIPFMSEGIKIADYNAAKGQGAGYNKEYNIKMKQIATQYTLVMNWVGDKINVINKLKEAGTISQGMSAEKVTLTRPNNLFTTEAPILLQAPGTGIGTNWVDEVGTAIDTWNMESYVDKANPTTQVSSLSSEEITAASNGESASAEFLLLPQEEVKPLSAVDPASPTIDKDTHSDATDASDELVIETYYGNIVIDNGAKDHDGKEIFSHANTKPNDEMKLSWAYNWMVLNSHREKAATTSTFYGEEVGAHGTLNAAIDLKYLDMSVVHIKSDQQLRDMIHVHEALMPGEAVTFTIDGNTDGEFEMQSSTVALLNENSNIKIQLCETAGEECNTIRLTTNVNQEIPSFEFLLDPSFDVTVILDETGADAAWTWKGDAKKMDNVDYVINEGTIAVADGAKINVETIKLFTNNGTINIAGKATQNVETVNNGTININEGAVYRVNVVDFYNEATALDKYGVINNKGYFGVVDGSGGTINNYGLIKQASKNARTFITTNATAGTSFATPFDAVLNNKMGTIELKAKDDNDFGVQDAILKGFIKWTVKDVETVTAEEIGTQANYVVIEGKTTTLNFTRNISENVNVLYVEFKDIENENNNEVMWNTTNTIIRGLIVNEGSALYIQKNNEVEVSQAALVKGTITKGAIDALTIPSFEGYLGGDTDDQENVLTTIG